jgi:integrase
MVKPAKRPQRSGKAPQGSDQASNRANPIAETLQTIRGYPDRLKIFRIPASSYWWVRATFGERRIKRSTKEESKAKAIAFAKQFYEDLLRNNHAVPLSTSRSFNSVAHSLQEEHRQKAGSGERNQRYETDLKRQLHFRIKPFFSQYALRDINYERLSAFIAVMRNDEVSPNTIKRYLVTVRQILKHAIKLNLLDKMPIFPTVSAKDNPRPWFSEDEYDLLKEKSKEIAKGDFAWKGERISIEAHYFITFMVNTFLRPSDWYGLQRKHIAVQERRGEDPILIISPTRSKTVNTPIVSMPAAVGVYRSLIRYQDENRVTAIEEQQRRIEAQLINDKKPLRKNASAKPVRQETVLTAFDDNSYVFLPHIESRPFVQAIMRAFFEKIVKSAGLHRSHGGSNRTIYSLRHTAIAFRLLKGENVDLLFLARNCRTSVDMIDRFYARHLSALMAPEKIVGLKTRWS